MMDIEKPYPPKFEEGLGQFFKKITYEPVEINFIRTPHMNDFLPPKKPIKQQFIDFLKREEVIFRYINNWDKSMFPEGTPIRNPRVYLCAFCWWKAPEGMEFWQDIETKWYEYLDNIGR